MKILVTGTNGQVGHALMRELTDHELIGLTRQDCDLTNLDQIRRVIDQHQPQLIINPAAYTKVDQAENEPELAFKINQDAPGVMAEKAREYSIPFIHFSTDYVFDGKKNDSYSEADNPRPLTLYGKSKLAGENLIQVVGGNYYIFRVSWIYSNIGKNFYLTIKQLCNEKSSLKIVSDQIGAPTSNLFIAEQIKKIIPKLSSENVGLYHLVPNGRSTWYEFTKEIVKPLKDNINVIPILTEDLNALVKRPKNSLLNNEKTKNTFMIKFKNWREIYKEFLYTQK